MIGSKIKKIKRTLRKKTPCPTKITTETKMRKSMKLKMNYAWMTPRKVNLNLIKKMQMMMEKTQM